MERVIKCSILTPERLIYEGEVGFAVVQAHNGELGFLYGHSPLISKLGVGEVRLNNPNKGIDYLMVEGGVVEIKNNNLIVLAERAFAQSDFSADELKERMKSIDDEINQLPPFDEEKAVLRLEKEKLKIRLKVALR
ncbi:MAG: ATP synthase F1 subunit epsilon [Leptospirales bacterium]|nr:ATP synthase F1 subunit epsilon [Leptospirales bacterium]